jgi:hypothetical protein
MGNVLDLKLLVLNYNAFVTLDIPVIFKIYFVLHGIALIILFMLLILNIHKYANLEISHGATYKEFEFPTYNFRSFLWSITDHRFWGIKTLYTFDIFLYYFMPLIIILYDCLFLNYELTHIFYYLPIIVPIILLQKVTKTMAHTDNTVQDLIWEIYYKKETCIYACTKE